MGATQTAEPIAPSTLAPEVRPLIQGVAVTAETPTAPEVPAASSREGLPGDADVLRTEPTFPNPPQALEALAAIGQTETAEQTAMNGEQASAPDGQSTAVTTEQLATAMAKLGEQVAQATRKEPTIVDKANELHAKLDGLREQAKADPTKVSEEDLQALQTEYRTTLVTALKNGEQGVSELARMEAQLVAPEVMAARLGEYLTADIAKFAPELAVVDPKSFLNASLHPENLALDPKSQRELASVLRTLPRRVHRAVKNTATSDQITERVTDARHRALFGGKEDWKEIKKDYPLPFIIEMIIAFMVGTGIGGVKNANPMRQQQ